MRTRGWGVAVVLAALALAGCDQTSEPAAVTVTQTVEVQQPVQQREQVVDDQTCEAMRAMRDTNERLARDGYADDYTEQYDQQLRAAGCD